MRIAAACGADAMFRKIEVRLRKLGCQLAMQLDASVTSS